MVTAVNPPESEVEKVRRGNRERQARWRDRRREKRAVILASYDPVPVDLSDPAGVIADWCAATLTVPTGLLAGQPFRLETWQVDWLREALGPGIREAALTTPRKLGKSGLIAAVLMCYLAWPLNQPGWRAIVVSLTGTLARELRRQVAEIADVSGLSEVVKDYATPTPERIVGLNKTEVTILAADKASGHAVGVDLTITDESGLIPESKRRLWDAVYSSVSTRNGRNLHISIRGDSPLFAELRARRDDPVVVWHEYAADENADLLDVDQWYKANPGLGRIKSLDYMRDAAARAVATPAATAGFRTLDLNLPGSPTQATIVAVADYLKCVVATLPPRAGDCWVALDVGGAAAFTGAAAYWPESGRCEVYAGVGGIPDAAARGQVVLVDPNDLDAEGGFEYDDADGKAVEWHTEACPCEICRVARLEHMERVVASLPECEGQECQGCGRSECPALAWQTLTVADIDKEEDEWTIDCLTKGRARAVAALALEGDHSDCTHDPDVDWRALAGC